MLKEEIAADVLTSIPPGISASPAVIAHEVPQELGDIAILLNSGYSKIRAFSYNLRSCVPGPGASTLPAPLPVSSHAVGNRENVRHDIHS
jgi:zinc transporter ZupT